MIVFVVILCLSMSEARVCYECYDRADCRAPSTVECPSDQYGCSTSILDIEPWITKGCLADDDGARPLRLNGCKTKTKNGVTGQICGCMNEDMCNSECMDTTNSTTTSCPSLQSVNLNAMSTDDNEATMEATAEDDPARNSAPPAAVTKTEAAANETTKSGAASGRATLSAALGVAFSALSLLVLN